MDIEVAEGTTQIGMALEDLDGDEQKDLITSDAAGNIYVYLGALASSTDLNTSDADITITGGNGDGLFGASIAVGDANGDDINDMIIGEPYNGENDEGAIHVVFGSPTWDNTIDITTHASVMEINGDYEDGIMGADLYVTDSDKNGADEIYTVHSDNEIYRIDLTGTLSAEIDSVDYTDSEEDKEEVDDTDQIDDESNDEEQISSTYETQGQDDTLNDNANDTETGDSVTGDSSNAATNAGIAGLSLIHI